MRTIVTCGPSYEPIDEVRRITNFSTGELGVRLANALLTAGHDVICLKGTAATYPEPLTDAEPVTFTTNDDLIEKLRALPNREQVGAVFHAAALADFKVKQTGAERKMSSREGEITLTLVPATKLIGKLRSLFPNAWIVGWKYELDGSREDAIAKARAQILENRTDACVVNGAAYGAGFGVLAKDGALIDLPDKRAVCAFLVEHVS